MISARILGAILYGAAAAAAGLGAAVLNGDALDVRTVREIAPLAFVVGAISGFGVVSSWPRNMSGSVITGVVMAVTALVFFSALYLIGEAFITAAIGDGPADPVSKASERLSERLPYGIPLAIGAFAAAGFLLWMLGAIGRGVRRGFRTRDA